MKVRLTGETKWVKSNCLHEETAAEQLARYIYEADPRDFDFDELFKIDVLLDDDVTIKKYEIKAEPDVVFYVEETR